MVHFNMSRAHPWLQDGAGGITASLGRVWAAVLVILPLHWPCLKPWGFSRVKPQGGSHWNFWLVYVHQLAQCKVRGAASVDLGDEHNSWVCPSLLQHCLCAVL